MQITDIEGGVGQPKGYRGRAMVMTGSVGQAIVRELNAVGATRVDFTWPSPGVTEVVITVLQEAVTTVETNALAVTLNDPPSDAVADAWLASSNSGTANSQRALISTKRGTKTLNFSEPITRMSALRAIGSDALTVIMEGV